MILDDDLSAKLSARLQAIVEDLLAKRGMSARRVSIEVVGHDGLIRDIRAGRMPGADRVAALLSYLGATEEFSFTTLLKDPAGEAEGSDVFQSVGQHPVSSERQPIVFSQAWLAKNNLEAEDLVLVTANDDRMTPTVPAGSQVLLDMTCTVLEKPDIYALEKDGSVVIARVSKQKDGIFLSFDCIGTPPEVIPPKKAGSVRVLGRAVWILRPA